MDAFQFINGIDERKLQQSYDRLNTLLKQSRSFAWEIDLDGTYTFVSPIVEDVLGYNADMMLNKMHFYDILAPEVREMIKKEAFEIIRQQRTLSNFEKKALKADGSTIWLSTICKPILNEFNQLVGYMGSDTDISTQKQLLESLDEARKQALKSAKAKETFLTNMSHEIRTPLNVIIGMIREIGKDTLTDAQKNYLKHAEASSYHLLSIINNVLDMSKIEAGEFTLDIKDFSLSAVLSNVNSILSSRASGKKIIFTVDAHNDIANALKGDSLRLSQVLINLLGNSIKFTDEGFVRLEVSLIDSSHEFQTLNFIIADSGIGMSEAYLKSLFGKFSQENDHSNRSYEGTGLGMSISKEIIELMGGDIVVVSKKGVGTQIEFNIKFPIGVEENLIRINKSTRNIDLSGVRVLVVEDNEMNRFIARQSLKQVGCVITEAGNGQHAIDILQNESFDLVLMDIQMPVMDGLEATKLLRTKMKVTTPIIALTANAFKHDIDLYLSEGMNDYLIKPYKEEELYAKIEQILRKSSGRTDGNVETLPSESSNSSSQLFSLKQISVIANGDSAFINTMISMFKEIVQSTVVQMNNALEANDIDQIKKLAHKIKPSLDNLEVNILYNEIRMLETYNEATGCPDNLQKVVGFVTQTLFQVNEQLNER